MQKTNRRRRTRELLKLVEEKVQNRNHSGKWEDIKRQIQNEVVDKSKKNPVVSDPNAKLPEITWLRNAN